MLFGGKDSFAIEFEIKTLYHNESFIGCGFFVVYINNFIYGIREDDATTFGSILHTLKKLNKSEFYSETPFNRLSDYEICDKFYDANYRIENRYSENVLNEFKSICITDNYKEVHGNYAKKYLNVWNPMEEAFDNGDFILQINENSKRAYNNVLSLMRSLFLYRRLYSSYHYHGPNLSQLIKISI